MIGMRVGGVVVQVAISQAVEVFYGPVGVALLVTGSTLILLRLYVRRVHLYWWVLLFFTVLMMQG
ncbi:hypothetical protein ACWDQ0_31115 [Streptomyces sp. NPDC003642]